MSDSILEPPGSIAIVGAGPLGIEAALYGRFLGYQATLIEAHEVGHSMREMMDLPTPMLPDRCLSPLALSAINAQNPDGPPVTLPTTVGQWIENILLPLTETDLLRGRLKCPAAVTSIVQVPVDQTETIEDANPTEPSDNEDNEPVAPDFQLNLDAAAPIVCEAVILATGAANTHSDQIKIEFDTPVPYFFRIGDTASGDSERDMLLGLKEIVAIYAQLADRVSLDLYAPKMPPPAEI